MKPHNRSGLSGLFSHRARRYIAPGLLALSFPIVFSPLSDPVAKSAGVCGPDIGEDFARVRYAPPRSNDNAKTSEISDLDAELAKLSQEKPVVMIGDTNHANKTLQSFLNGKKLVHSLYKAGIKNIYIETPQIYQGMIDELSTNPAAREVYISTLARSKLWVSGAERRKQAEEEADFIHMAQKLGMHIIAVDSQKNIDKNKIGPAFDYIRKLAKTHGEMCPGAASMTPSYHKYYQVTRMFSTIAAAPALHALSQLRDDDRDNFEFIQDAKHTKSAFIYGAAHYNAGNAGSLYSHLKDKVASVIFMSAADQELGADTIALNASAVRYKIKDSDLSYDFAMSEEAAPPVLNAGV